MNISLTDDNTKKIFVDILLELLTKRQDILDEVITQALQRVAEKTHAADSSKKYGKQNARAYFEAINLDFSAYKFNREQANER